MIISQISDGLGNQLFQYATGYAVAQKHQVPFKLEKHWFTHESNSSVREYCLDHFNIHAEDASYEEIDRYIFKDTNFHRIITPYFWRSRVFEGASKFDPKFLKIRSHAYLLGHWQSWRYFHKYKHQLLTEFSIITPQDEKSKGYHDRILNTNSVGIHVRRGDYLTNSRFNALGIDYYRSAVEYLSDRKQTLEWFIFSDDLSWTKENLSFIPNATYVEGLSAIEDFRLLNKCKHNVIANSTFSWWAGYLKDDENALVISPKQPFDSDSLYAPKDFLPPEFILI